MREGIQAFHRSLHRNAYRSRPSNPTVTSKGPYSSNLPRCPSNRIHARRLTERGFRFVSVMTRHPTRLDSLQVFRGVAEKAYLLSVSCSETHLSGSLSDMHV